MTSQDLADGAAAAYPNLQQLFGAYFHQDWPLDGSSWQEVVALFASQNSATVVVGTADELDRLLAGDPDEASLSIVVARLGGSVDPGAWGVTPRRWLAELAARLRDPGVRPRG